MTPLQLDAPDFTRRYLNLADPRIGAEAVSASDDFFAPKERMLNPEPAMRLFCRVPQDCPKAR